MTAQCLYFHRAAQHRNDYSVKRNTSSHVVQKTPTAAKVQHAFQQAEKLHRITNARLRHRTSGPFNGPCPGAPRPSSTSLPNLEDSEEDDWMVDVCYYNTTDDGWCLVSPGLLLNVDEECQG